MKKKMGKIQNNNMLPEYNFKGKQGVRGKYANSLQQRYSVRMLNEDGTITNLEEFDALIQQARKQAKVTGLKKKDIEAAITKVRERKR